MNAVIDRIIADEIIRTVTSGRTRPLLMRCDVDADSPKELFCKISEGCDQEVTSLAKEVVAACLAHDLGLPVPVPYLVDIPTELVSVVSDVDIATRLQASSSVCFGSSKVHQFGAWSLGSRVTEAMQPVALSALVFDAVIENPDRRPSNPNCLVSGDHIRLIDHELAFPSTAMMIGRLPPWQNGGLSWIEQPDGHIFRKQLKHRGLDYSLLPGIWSSVSDARLQDYRSAIPSVWSEALPVVDDALDRIRMARDNIAGVIAEIQRVLL